jgi:hypothetical protein
MREFFDGPCTTRSEIAGMEALGYRPALMCFFNLRGDMEVTMVSGLDVGHFTSFLVAGPAYRVKRPLGSTDWVTWAIGPGACGGGRASLGSTPADLTTPAIKVVDAKRAKGYEPVLLAFIHRDEHVRVASLPGVDVPQLMRAMADELTGEVLDLEVGN